MVSTIGQCLTWLSIVYEGQMVVILKNPASLQGVEWMTEKVKIAGSRMANKINSCQFCSIETRYPKAISVQQECYYQLVMSAVGVRCVVAAYWPCLSNILDLEKALQSSPYSLVGDTSRNLTSH